MAEDVIVARSRDVGLRVARVGCAWIASALWASAAWAQIAVGDNGVPSFNHPIAAPPGVAGMAPQLALAYSGGGVNGPMGLGWSLQGLSSIVRCPATRAVDGRRGAVTYGRNDKLCLDGQRLIRTDVAGESMAFPQNNDAGGVDGQSYAEFRTEKDTFSRVRAYGYANGDTSGASGPAYFRVWTKDGKIFDYGANPAVNPTGGALIGAPNKPPVAWAVARISDPRGNFIDFKYEQRDVAWGSGTAGATPTAGREWNLSEVQYSGNKVVLGYDLDAQGNDARADKSEAYQLGGKSISARRLKTITTYVNSRPDAAGANGGTAVRTTTLGYDTSGVTRRSRLSRIQECVGGPGGGRCLPATQLRYSAGGSDAYEANAAFTASAMATQNLLGNGTTGVVSGDFNGDGRTDVLMWSDTPSANRLHLSNGDGTFTQSAAFNITGAHLFKSNGCYYSIAADFNADGITDLLRVMRNFPSTGGGSCGTVSNVLYLGRGDGGFTALNLPPGVDLSQATSIQCGGLRCENELGQSFGANYYLIDVNDDGFTDIVTTILPGKLGSYPPPPEQVQCASTVCTRIFLGSASGAFAEMTGSNVAHHSLYAPPPNQGLDYWRKPYVIDADGDGLPDLMVTTGLWVSNGDGNFSFRPSSSFAAGCANPIDFNGDGRADCLNASNTASAQTLTIGDGTLNLPVAANFNLTASGQELQGPSTPTAGQGVGTVVADFNGDGRQDILRWKESTLENVLYLSNGDGSFTASSSFNLAGLALQKLDGTVSLVTGDFTGRGTMELLRLQTINGVVLNRLFTRVDATPPDLLVGSTGPTGLKTDFYYVPLANSTPSNGVSDAGLGPRYVSDLGNSAFAVSGASEVSASMYVVATIVGDAGVGSTRLQTEMAYRGLKADRNGRGPQGFRQVLRQRPGADGSPVTTDTRFMQWHPYSGSVADSATYLGKLSAVGGSLPVNAVHNVYCDQTNAAAASPSAHCAVSAKVVRPYLYQSTETAYGLDGIALPTRVTTNAVNANGDPTEVRVVTSGSVAGVTQTFTKVVGNQYQAADTSCDDVRTCRWVTGRLARMTVTGSVPNSLDAIASSAGNGPHATDTQGSGVPPSPPGVSPAVLQAILALLLDD